MNFFSFVILFTNPSLQMPFIIMCFIFCVAKRQRAWKMTSVCGGYCTMASTDGMVWRSRSGLLNMLHLFHNWDANRKGKDVIHVNSRDAKLGVGCISVINDIPVVGIWDNSFAIYFRRFRRNRLFSSSSGFGTKPTGLQISHTLIDPGIAHAIT